VGVQRRHQLAPRHRRAELRLQALHRKEDAENPERWMARQSEAGPCQLKPLERTADSMKWEVSCPKTNSHGSGVARLTGPGTVESDLQMTTEIQGYRVQTNTRTTGKRLGPCKS
jgi:hypothetical protein